MKNITYAFLFSIGFLLLACNNPSADQPGQANNVEEAVPEANLVRQTGKQQDLSVIETGPVSYRKISSVVECAGRVEVPPKNQYSIYSPVTGFVKFVKHLPGEYVKKGTVLTSIEHPELIHLQREFLEGQSQLVFLKSEYDRKKNLMDQEAGSTRAFEEAKANYGSRMAHDKGLRAELELIGISTERLLENGTILPEINLYAPVSGYLIEVNVNHGKLVEPSYKLFEIMDTRHIHLDLEVFASDISKIKKGQKLEVSAAGITESFPAEVHMVGKNIDPATRSAIVHAHFNSIPKTIIPGMYVTARIYYDEVLVPAIHESAILKESENDFVFLKSNEGFKKIKVQTGRQDGEFVELLNWNYGNEIEIVSRNAYYVQEGGE